MTARPTKATSLIAARIVGDPGEFPRCVVVDSQGLAAIGHSNSTPDDGEWEPFRVTEDPIIDVAFNSDGTLMACATARQIVFWDVAQDPPREACASHTPDAIPLAIAIDEHVGWCAMGDSDGSIQVVATRKAP